MDSPRVAAIQAVRDEPNQHQSIFVSDWMREVGLGFVSELCHIPPETLGQHRHLRGHVDAHRCCGKLLIGNVLG